MTPYWSDAHLTLYGGDCREVLAFLPERSVHCVVTSPPYWALRDYGTDGQLGLEPTPDEYVANMVAVFREVRRVLRDDGTLWLVLGDSYAHSTVVMPHHRGAVPKGVNTNADAGKYGRGVGERRHGLKPKDLVGIPWRVAFALQADGWYLRSDIIWAKPNPMPESVTDRPTKSHEYVFLLTKQARYYFDADAVREDVSKTPGAESRRRNFDPTKQRNQSAHAPRGGGAPGPRAVDAAGRNLRSVWHIATEPYPGAHFATFPRELVEPCVKAGTSERGVCPECGAPWERVVERGTLANQDPEAAAWIAKSGVDIDDLRRLGKSGAMRFDEHRLHGATRLVGGDFDAVLAQRLYDKLGGWLGRCVAEACGRETTGWRPSCRHELEPVPATVLDPFAGSGTTLFVAQALGRRAIGIDLNPEYLKQALERNAQTPLGLAG